MLGNPNVECSGVDAVDISPTLLHMEYTVCIESMGALPPRTPALSRKLEILQTLHLRMLIHRARVPVRVVDQLLDWLVDGLAATGSSIAMTFPLTKAYPCH